MNRIEISNYALTQLGERPIQDFPPGEETENSRRCDAMLKLIIPSMIAKFNWKFALRAADLVEMASESSDIAEYVYAMPGDCARAVNVLPLSHTDTWYVVGSRLICNYDEVTLIYISTQAKEGPFPDWFSMAAAKELSLALAPALSRTNEYIGFLRSEAKTELSEAKAIDSNQGNEYPAQGMNPREDSFITGASQAT